MIHLDTIPDHWRCRICDVRDPHLHKVFNRKFNTWYHEDHGYDSRDEEDYGGETENPKTS